MPHESSGAERRAAVLDDQTPPLTLDYPDSELVFGLVYAVGTEYGKVQSVLEDRIKLSHFTPKSIHLSDRLAELARNLGADVKTEHTDELERISSLIHAGNEVRRISGRADFVALAASAFIASSRARTQQGSPAAHRRVAWILSSLKRPEEVETLRKIYGPGFFLIGIFATEAERRDYLARRKGIGGSKQNALILRDQKETGIPFGQRTRDTFELPDVFVELSRGQYEEGIIRFLSLVFGNPHITPTRDEHAMFMAYSASLRSGALGRQVGASLYRSKSLVAIGCNDVPVAGGGLCSDEEERGHRDALLGEDPNEVRKAAILSDTVERLRKKFLPQADPEGHLREAQHALDGGLLSEITEFGCDVHAEMDAVLTCARSGLSVQDSVLYTTTFSCHNCARHLIAAGVERVVYIEPYPKSKARELHADAIQVVGDELPGQGDQGAKRIPFVPFVGIGPRRFFDLYSLKLSAGYAIERKQGSKPVSWDVGEDSRPRVPMAPTSYLEREQLVTRKLEAMYENARERKNG